MDSSLGKLDDIVVSKVTEPSRKWIGSLGMLDDIVVSKVTEPSRKWKFLRNAG